MAGFTERSSQHGHSDFELRLFLEEICCDLCRFYHTTHDGIAPELISIDQEVCLGEPGAFADVRVRVPGRPTYFLEVKYGYSASRVIDSFRRKYSRAVPAVADADRVILIVDTSRFSDWPALKKELQSTVIGSLAIEVWDEATLLRSLHDVFKVNLTEIGSRDLHTVRVAIETAKSEYAFGQNQVASAQMAALLWHFSFWNLRQLREKGISPCDDALRPGKHPEVVVIMADLTSFSGYVRDTPNEWIVRDCLTSFYAKARYQIINSGGMLYQFLGDAALGLFGLPLSGRRPRYVDDALECARALSEIGEAVSNEWQRQIDRVQQGGGAHIGMAIGDLQVLPLRPFGRAHIGIVGDAINMAARVGTQAASGEIVVSNSLFQRLDPISQESFIEMEPVDAKNVGRIRAWRTSLKTKGRS